MKYPKPIMRKKELVELGFDEEWLMYVYRRRTDRKIAWKAGISRNSPILYDTERLEKLRQDSCTGR